ADRRVARHLHLGGEEDGSLLGIVEAAQEAVRYGELHEERHEAARPGDLESALPRRTGASRVDLHAHRNHSRRGTDFSDDGGEAARSGDRGAPSAADPPEATGSRPSARRRGAKVSIAARENPPRSRGVSIGTRPCPPSGGPPEPARGTEIEAPGGAAPEPP